MKPAAFDGFYSVDGMSSDNTRVATLTEHMADLGFGLDAGYQFVNFVPPLFVLCITLLIV